MLGADAAGPARPVVMLIHGGGPTGGTPLQDLDWAEPLVARGFVACMAGYRLLDLASGENGWPTQLEDARSALRWVRAQAAELGGDSRRVGVLGHSSGGHLAGLLGTTEDTVAAAGGLPTRADCVVSISGDADLSVPYPDPSITRVLSTLFGGTPEEAPGVWRAASPASNVDARTVPFLVIHGEHDESVPVDMGRNLAAALTQAGIEHVYAELPAGHMDICDSEAASALWHAFLGEELRP